MSYLDYIHHFWRKENLKAPFMGNEALLYFHLLEVSNDLDWPEVFPLSNPRICGILGLSPNTMKAARRRLIERNLIHYEAGTGRGDNGRYQILTPSVIIKQEKESKSDTLSDILPESYQKLTPYESEKLSEIDTFSDERNQNLTPNENEKIDKFANNETFIKKHPTFSTSPSSLGSSRKTIDRNIEENRDNINSSILNVNTILNSGVQLENQTPSQSASTSQPDPMHPGAHTVIPYITVGQQRISPDEIGILLKIRGVSHERIASFVEENRGKTYNDMDELRNLVRVWLRSSRPERAKPKLGIEEQIKNFRVELANYRRNNPNKYTDDFYKDFFEYWTTPNASVTLIRREKDNFFNLGQKLAYAYKNIWLPNLKRNETFTNNKSASGNPATGSGSGKTTGHVDFSQFINSDSGETNSEAVVEDTYGEVLK
ncbi:hypothetical protein ACFPMF_11225 [Larkinella bovis]|uniref:Helix-turn-helix domain-containing protein n=1 Tax=Larkinella bovis TaxID=683041 RepID=A0ABW0IEU3_9BACT